MAMAKTMFRIEVYIRANDKGRYLWTLYVNGAQFAQSYPDDFDTEDGAEKSAADHFKAKGLN